MAEGKICSRLFFALWPDANESMQLERVVGLLKMQWTARWISSSNWHVTLAFLGPVESDRWAGVDAVASAVRAEPFSVCFDRLALWDKGRVLCLTATEPPPGLIALQQGLSTGLLTLGVTMDSRPYQPHLTLGRNAACATQDRVLPEPISIVAKAFVLAQSRPSAQGSVYSLAKIWRLGAEP